MPEFRVLTRTFCRLNTTVFVPPDVPDSTTTVRSSLGIRALLLLALLGIASLLFAFVTTMAAWHIQIENRAFRCTDDIGFGAFWADIDLHRQAGDTRFPGWTWDSLKLVRTLYLVGFFLIWSLSFAAPLLSILRSGSRRRVAAG